jgi:hypothetical protein
MTNLRLDLDELFDYAYFYTKYDIGGEGHAITIREEDKERFLDAFTAEFRRETERRLIVDDY